MTTLSHRLRLPGTRPIYRPGRVVADVVRPSRHRSWRQALVRVLIMLAVLAVAGGVAVAGFSFQGGRWFTVETPSMGTAAPVGSLVVTRPVTIDQLRVGDVIAFHPPTTPGETYTHRVVAISPDSGSGPNSGPNSGSGYGLEVRVRTRGDINGADDPWQLTGADLIGRAVLLAPGVGYLAKAVPVVVLVTALVWVLARMWVPTRARRPVVFTAAWAAYLAETLRLRPFVAVRQLTLTTDPDGSAHFSLVSTGILPVQVTTADGYGHSLPVTMGYGGTGVANVHGPSNHLQYLLDAQLHLSWHGWVLIIALWASPLLTSLARVAYLARRARAAEAAAAAEAVSAADVAAIMAAWTGARPGEAMPPVLSLLSLLPEAVGPSTTPPTHPGGPKARWPGHD